MLILILIYFILDKKTSDQDLMNSRKTLTSQSALKDIEVYFKAPKEYETVMFICAKSFFSY